MEERLAEILEMAKADPALRQALLDTKKEKYPVHAFCDKIKELGYDISVGELIEMGEEFEAAMIRSVNGGGVNSPYGAWDDMYDVFFAALEW